MVILPVVLNGTEIDIYHAILASIFSDGNTYSISECLMLLFRRALIAVMLSTALQPKLALSSEKLRGKNSNKDYNWNFLSKTTLIHS